MIVGVVGLGNMGGRIARRLVDGGEEVVGFDLDAARAADAGAVAAASPAALAHFAATVHHMGASGSGHAAKLLNNFLNATSPAATAEVMVAGRKDLMLYLELVRDLGVTSRNGPPCLAAFHLAAALGYGEQISNRVVDALGDIAGGVRIHGQTREAT